MVTRKICLSHNSEEKQQTLTSFARLSQQQKPMSPTATTIIIKSVPSSVSPAVINHYLKTKSQQRECGVREYVLDHTHKTRTAQRYEG